MKNSIKLLGFAAIVAVIGFSFITCEQPIDTPTVTLTGITAEQ